jgi:hypothetical protein
LALVEAPDGDAAGSRQRTLAAAAGVDTLSI